MSKIMRRALVSTQIFPRAKVVKNGVHEATLFGGDDGYNLYVNEIWAKCVLICEGAKAQHEFLNLICR